MSRKINIRSFRYTDEVACILQSHPGTSLNQKFENLVIDYSRTLILRQHKLQQVNDQIRESEKEFQDLKKQYHEFIRLYVTMKKFTDTLLSFNKNIDNVLSGKFPSGIDPAFTPKPFVHESMTCPNCEQKTPISVLKRNSYVCKNCGASHKQMA